LTVAKNSKVTKKEGSDDQTTRIDVIGWTKLILIGLPLENEKSITLVA